eukprot:gb/GECG01014774.1/.p1 GENE.gb/GECG01014774.1/~~gb/GECG01014774.1/.p1  ORF type:complete len:1393 (+),score=134.28 gb/GECG01014774.1/:1-4179(+)
METCMAGEECIATSSFRVYCFWVIILGGSLATAYLETYILQYAFRKAHKICLDVLKEGGLETPQQIEERGGHRQEENDTGYFSRFFRYPFKNVLGQAVLRTIESHVFVEALHKTSSSLAYIFCFTTIQWMMWMTAISSRQSAKQFMSFWELATGFAVMFVLWLLMLMSLILFLRLEWKRYLSHTFRARPGYDDSQSYASEEKENHRSIYAVHFLTCIFYLLGFATLMEFGKNPITGVLPWFFGMAKEVVVSCSTKDTERFTTLVVNWGSAAFHVLVWVSIPGILNRLTRRVAGMLSHNCDFRLRSSFIENVVASKQRSFHWFTYAYYRTCMYAAVALCYSVYNEYLYALLRRQVHFLARSGMDIAKEQNASWKLFFVFSLGLLMFLWLREGESDLDWVLKEIYRLKGKVVSTLRSIPQAAYPAGTLHLSSSGTELVLSLRRLYLGICEVKQEYEFSHRDLISVLHQNSRFQRLLQEISYFCQSLQQLSEDKMVHFSISKQGERNPNSPARESQTNCLHRISVDAQKIGTDENGKLMSSIMMGFGEDGAWELGFSMSRTYLSYLLRSLSDMCDSELVVLDIAKSRIQSVLEVNTLQHNTFALVVSERSRPTSKWMLRKILKYVSMTADVYRNASSRTGYKPFPEKRVEMQGVHWNLTLPDVPDHLRSDTSTAGGVIRSISAAYDSLPQVAGQLEQLMHHLGQFVEDVTSVMAPERPPARNTVPSYENRLPDRQPLPAFDANGSIRWRNMEISFARSGAPLRDRGIISVYGPEDEDLHLRESIADVEAFVKSSNLPSRVERVNNSISQHYRTYNECYHTVPTVHQGNMKSLLNLQHPFFEFFYSLSPFRHRYIKRLLVSKESASEGPYIFSFYFGNGWIVPKWREVVSSLQKWCGEAVEKSCFKLVSQWLRSCNTLFNCNIALSCNSVAPLWRTAASVFCPSSCNSVSFDTRDTVGLSLHGVGEFTLPLGTVHGSLDFVGQLKNEASSECLRLSNVLQVQGIAFQFVSALAEQCCANMVPCTSATLNDLQQGSTLPVSSAHSHDVDIPLAPKVESRVHLELCRLCWRLEHWRRRWNANAIGILRLDPCYSVGCDPIECQPQETKREYCERRLLRTLHSLEVDALSKLWEDMQASSTLDIAEAGLIGHDRALFLFAPSCPCSVEVGLHCSPSGSSISGLNEIQRILSKVLSLMVSIIKASKGLLTGEYETHREVLFSLDECAAEVRQLFSESRTARKGESNLIKRLRKSYSQLYAAETAEWNQDSSTIGNDDTIERLCRQLQDLVSRQPRQGSFVREWTFAMLRTQIGIFSSLMSTTSVHRRSTLILVEFCFRMVAIAKGDAIPFYYIPPSLGCRRNSLAHMPPLPESVFFVPDQQEAVAMNTSLKLSWVSSQNT